MKKIVLPLVVAVCVLGLVACTGDKGGNKGNAGTVGGNNNSNVGGNGNSNGNGNENVTLSEAEIKQKEMITVVENFLVAAKEHNVEKATESWWACTIGGIAKRFSLSDEIALMRLTSGIYNTRNEMFAYSVEMAYERDALDGYKSLSDTFFDEDHEKYVRPSEYGRVCATIAGLSVDFEMLYDKTDGKWVIFDMLFDGKKWSQFILDCNDSIFGDGDGSAMPENYITDLMNKELAENTYTEKDVYDGELSDAGNFTIVVPRPWRVEVFSDEVSNGASLQFQGTGIGITNASIYVADEDGDMVRKYDAYETIEEYMNWHLKDMERYMEASKIVNIISGKFIGVNEEFKGFVYEEKGSGDSAGKLRARLFIESNGKIYAIGIDSDRDTIYEFLFALKVIATIDFK